MPRMNTTADFLVSNLRKMGWVDRQHQMQRLRQRHFDLWTQVASMMSPDEILDGTHTGSSPAQNQVIAMPDKGQKGKGGKGRKGQDAKGKAGNAHDGVIAGNVGKAGNDKGDTSAGNAGKGKSAASAADAMGAGRGVIRTRS